jgi:hypothetical protein
MDAQELHSLDRALPRGAANGTSIPALAYELEWDERKVRAGIQELRRDRHVAVATLPRPNGVFVVTSCEDLDELRRSRDGLRSRAMSLLVTVRDLDEVIADIAYSPTLFG